MNDLYLKFPDEATAQAALYDGEMVPGIKTVTKTVYTVVNPNYDPNDEDDYEFFSVTALAPGQEAVSEREETYEVPDPDNLVERLVPKFRNIDVIGIIYERTGGTDEEPVMTPIPGWHVNVRLADEDGAALEPYAVTVATPVRVWA